MSVPYKVLKSKILSYLKVVGPGLIVMLADTDSGCLLTAAQSGARWGYTMILPQIVLIPILYMAQEMTVRLGIVTNKGHGELIRQYFGKGWANIAAITLMISVIGALITEFIGIGGVCQLFGIPLNYSIPIATILLIAVAFIGKYRKIEKVGIMVGLAELMFVIALFFVHPRLVSLAQGMVDIPLTNSSYLYLVAANVGAVIMPWMIFYQQGAVIERHLTCKNIQKEKMDTKVGTFITQLIMIGFIILFAAATDGHSVNLRSIQDLVITLQPYLGTLPAKFILGGSILGGSLVAAFVVTMAGTWGVTEVLQWPHSLNEKLNRHNLGFYGLYALTYIVSAAISLIPFNLIDLTIAIEVMNALLLPLVLGFLLILESKALPHRYQMHGLYKWVVVSSCSLVMIFGLYMIGPTIGIW